MKVLILGSGGREHVLANIYSQSKKIKKVFVVPGNDLMSFNNDKVLTYSDVTMTDFEKILEICQKERVDFVDVAQDDVLAAGFVDKFQKEGFQTFGPTQKAAQIEWSKEWARNFMQKYNLPSPEFKSFHNQTRAIDHINSKPEKLLYIKASGLAAGKGSIRAENKKQAIEAVSQMGQFGKAGETFLIEGAMVGEEFSLFAICDGDHYLITKTAQDHKTVYEKDQGPNTGGMGCVAPTSVITPSIIRTIEKQILKPFIKGMEKEERPYLGIIYLGGMITNQGVKIIEFNARWGDPEAEVILPSLKTDYFKIVEAVWNQKLNQLKIDFDQKTRISVTGCSHGYPGDYSKVKGKEIFGLTEAMKLPGITVFGAGIKRKGKRFFANGGRIFHLVAEGKNIIETRRRAYEAMSLIYIEGNNLHYRTDIGWGELKKINR